jgi:hypothetical protein
MTKRYQLIIQDMENDDPYIDDRISFQLIDNCKFICILEGQALKECQQDIESMIDQKYGHQVNIICQPDHVE